MSTAFPAMPSSLQAALDAPVADRRPWQNDIAPTYIGLFLLVAYYDGMSRQTLAVGGLMWSLVGAAVAGLLCFVLLYYVPAMWGMRSRQPLAVVATSTFGASGSPWIPGVVGGMVQVVWLAVAVYYAASVALDGLVDLRLIDPRALEPIHLFGLTLQSPLFLFVTLVWTLSSAVIGIHVVRLVAAVMKAYAVFPAIALALAMLWALPGLHAFRPLAINPVSAEPVREGGMLAVAAMIQFVFGFFAPAGAAAADWGSYTRGKRDIQLGGLVGVTLAALILSAVPMFTVAGALGRSPTPPGLAPALAAQRQLERLYSVSKPDDPNLAAARAEVRAIAASNFTYREVIARGIGGLAGAVMLLLFGLAMLGPSCFAPFVFGHRFMAVAPRVPRWAWSLIGGVVAWPLVALGAPGRPELLYSILGAVMAPVVGAMAADYLRNRGTWPGPRKGVNVVGCVAWILGLVVGLVLPLATEAGLPGWSRVQPADVLAFLVAFLVYTVLAWAGLEPPIAAASTSAPTRVDPELEGGRNARLDSTEPAANASTSGSASGPESREREHG
jgi:cytosine/uracil/thiamine/allantoin permease